MNDLATINNVSEFADHVGSEFRIETDGSDPILLKLVQAEPHNEQSQSGETPREAKAFSLLFDVAEGLELPQQTYHLSHGQIGELMLFMTPVGPGKLESIFN